MEAATLAPARIEDLAAEASTLLAQIEEGRFRNVPAMGSFIDLCREGAQLEARAGATKAFTAFLKRLEVTFEWYDREFLRQYEEAGGVLAW